MITAPPRSLLPLDLTDTRRDDDIMVSVISDTHGRHRDLPYVEADVVLFCGDEASSQHFAKNAIEAEDFFDWYRDYPAEHKVFLPGNHSLAFQAGMYRGDALSHMGIITLVNESVSLHGYKLYGSPYSPLLGRCGAYMRPRERMSAVWELIPDDVDILLTHGPPQGVLDMARDYDQPENGEQLIHVGCQALRQRVDAVQPLLHCFGHIHDSPLKKNFGYLPKPKTYFVNATCCDNVNAIANHGLLIRLPRRE